MNKILKKSAPVFAAVTVIAQIGAGFFTVPVSAQAGTGESRNSPPSFLAGPILPGADGEPPHPSVFVVGYAPGGIAALPLTESNTIDFHPDSFQLENIQHAGLNSANPSFVVEAYPDQDHQNCIAYGTNRVAQTAPNGKEYAFDAGGTGMEIRYGQSAAVQIEAPGLMTVRCTRPDNTDPQFGFLNINDSQNPPSFDPCKDSPGGETYFFNVPEGPNANHPDDSRLPEVIKSCTMQSNRLRGAIVHSPDDGPIEVGEMTAYDPPSDGGAGYESTVIETYTTTRVARKTSQTSSLCKGGTLKRAKYKFGLAPYYTDYADRDGYDSYAKFTGNYPYYLSEVHDEAPVEEACVDYPVSDDILVSNRSQCQASASAGILGFEITSRYKCRTYVLAADGKVGNCNYRHVESRINTGAILAFAWNLAMSVATLGSTMWFQAAQAAAAAGVSTWSVISSSVTNAVLNPAQALTSFVSSMAIGDVANFVYLSTLQSVAGAVGSINNIGTVRNPAPQLGACEWSAGFADVSAPAPVPAPAATPAVTLPAIPASQTPAAVPGASPLWDANRCAVSSESPGTDWGSYDGVGGAWCSCASRYDGASYNADKYPVCFAPQAPAPPAVLPASPVVSHVPAGSHDGAEGVVSGRECSIKGWAVDSGTGNPVDVHIYADGPAGQGRLIGQTAANAARPDVCSAYPNFSCSAGFDFALPDDLRDNASHAFYVYGINPAGGVNPVLQGSPKRMTCAAPRPNTLVLNRGESKYSASGRTVIIMQSDGNLVVYVDNAARWKTNTANGSMAVMQGDGNFVLYDDQGTALWSSRTQGNPGATLAVQDDGNLVIYSAQGAVLWNTGTVVPAAPPAAPATPATPPPSQSASSSVSQIGGAPLSPATPSFPPAPGGLSVACPLPGTAATLSWSAVSGALRYAMRIDDTANAFSTDAANIAAGGCGAVPNPGDACGFAAGTAYTHSSAAGHTYKWWVHACNASGCGAGSQAQTFSCSAAGAEVRGEDGAAGTPGAPGTPQSLILLNTGFATILDVLRENLIALNKLVENMKIDW